MPSQWFDDRAGRRGASGGARSPRTQRALPAVVAAWFGVAVSDAYTCVSQGLRSSYAPISLSCYLQ